MHKPARAERAFHSDLAPPAAAAGGPLLVASSGASGADAAIVAARLLAGRTGAEVQLIAIVPQRPAGDTMGRAPSAGDAVRSPGEVQQQTTAQVERVAGPDVHWAVTVRTGEPAQIISTAAPALGARLIVLGRAERAPGERLRGAELVLRVLQLGDTPVFAAAPGLARLPRQVVVATDFSDVSRYAAQVALQFIAPDAAIHVVNVMPEVTTSGGAWEQDGADSCHQGLSDAFRSASEALERDGLTVDTTLLTGDPADTLLAFAGAREADLIVCAAHGHGFIRRLILGSVSTDLVRGARCSVLCVPGPAGARAAHRAPADADATTRSYSVNEWVGALQQFTKRNEGRLCTIEIDHADFGAQVQGSSLPFIGAVYDQRGNMAELMFGEMQLPGRHLSNSIPRVSAIDIVVDADGRDSLLRIANDKGQTVLTLTSPPTMDDDNRR